MEGNIDIEPESSHHKKVRKSVLDHFNRISSENEATRLKFGVILLKHICSNEVSDKENHELKYATIRLIRGLGASKFSSKVGYYTTLVALLQACPLITVDDVLQCVKKQLQTGSSKSEKGDVYTGQILACGALLHSDLFGKATLEEQHNILQQIFAAGKKRSYLTLVVSVFIADLLSKIDTTQFHNAVWPALKEEVLKVWTEQTIDSLYLLTLVLNHFPHALKDASLKKHFGDGGVYSEENLKPICDILMNIAALSSLKHPGYVTISQEIAKSNELLPLFMTHIDNHLVHPNRNRILASALIIKNILQLPEAGTPLPDLLPNNFIKQALFYYNAQSNDQDKDFQQAMTAFFDSLYKTCQKNIDDKLKIATLKKFLFNPGTLMFEKITKTKVIQHFVSALNTEGVKKLSKVYRSVIAAKKEKVDDTLKGWMNIERAYAAQLLVKLLNLPSMQNDFEWKRKQLKFLINVSIIKHSKYPNVGVELSGELTEIFYRALDLKFTKLEDMRILLFDLVNHISSLVTPDNFSTIVRVSLSSDDFGIWQNALTIINKLSNKTKKYVAVFHILFLHMALQLYKEKELAISSLKELFLCYERVRKERKHDKHEQNETEPEWIEVVTDLFLNLLSHNSHMLRNVIKSVFPHLCKYVTTSSLHQILSVLDPKNESNPLSKNEHDGEESSSEDEGNDDDDDKSIDESDESESEIEETDEKQTITDKLRTAVSKALGNDGYKTDEESIDLDQMSETEGEKLNEALSLAFKQFKPNRGKSKKQTKDEETLTHFRVRVLDLLEIYINSEPSMLSCFEIMLPLLQALEFTVRDPHQSPLQARLKYCLKRLTGLRKFATTEEVTPEVLNDLLSSLLTKGTKSALIFQDMSSEIAECCIFVIRCAHVITNLETTHKKTKKHLKFGILQIVTDALGMYFKNRDCLIPYSLFKSIFQLNWDGIFVLVPVVFSYVFDELTRPFRRSQSLELLKIFYSNNRIRTNPQIFKDNVREHEVEICNKIVKLLDQFCANPHTTVIKERFIYHIFNLLKAMLTKDIKNEDIDWSCIGEKVREYRSHVTLSKDAKKSYNQLCSRLGISNIVKMKNQVVKPACDDNESIEDTPKAIKQIKRKLSNSESKKLKKETRDLRIQSMSEGLSNSVCFSNSLLSLEDNKRESTILSTKLAAQECAMVQNEASETLLVNGTSAIKKRLNSENEDVEKLQKKKKKKQT